MRCCIPKFASRLKKIMISSKLNQRDFAKKVGITQAAVSLLLNGHRDPAASTLLKLSKATGYSIDFLFGLGDF